MGKQKSSQKCGNLFASGKGKRFPATSHSSHVGLVQGNLRREIDIAVTCKWSVRNANFSAGVPGGATVKLSASRFIFQITVKVCLGARQLNWAHLSLFFKSLLNELNMTWLDLSCREPVSRNMFFCFFRLMWMRSPLAAHRMFIWLFFSCVATIKMALQVIVCILPAETVATCYNTISYGSHMSLES